jgi:hypothetical protein
MMLPAARCELQLPDMRFDSASDGNGRDEAANFTAGQTTAGHHAVRI